MSHERHQLYLSEVAHSNHRFSVHGLCALDEIALVPPAEFQGVALFPAVGWGEVTHEFLGLSG